MERHPAAAPRGRAPARFPELRRIRAGHAHGAQRPAGAAVPARPGAVRRSPPHRPSSRSSRPSRAASSTPGTSPSTPKRCSAAAIPSRRKSCGRISRCRACSRACSRPPSGCSTCASASAPGQPVWHPDVRFYRNRIRGRQARRRLLSRRVRAPAQAQRRLDGRLHRPQAPAHRRDPAGRLSGVQLPAAQQASRPALLTHDDVVTLFHEFGHGLHHLLTRVDYPSLAGINGVAWDAVELPSQFLENYAWHPGRAAADLEPRRQRRAAARRRSRRS